MYLLIVIQVDLIVSHPSYLLYVLLNTHHPRPWMEEPNPSPRVHKVCASRL